MSVGAVNWHDVLGRRITVGPLDSTCRDLGLAAGTRKVGLRRFEIEPGKRSTPAHTHSGEEEIFYVLAGSGLSWQASATHRIEAGDCLVHRIDGPAHTLIAGPDGLDVLAFGERTASEACYLPRARVAWLGASWVKAGETDHPFAQEAAVGDLEMPQPSSRPDSIVRAADVELTRWEHGDSVCSRRELGLAAGRSVRTCGSSSSPTARWARRHTATAAAKSCSSCSPVAARTSTRRPGSPGGSLRNTPSSRAMS